MKRDEAWIYKFTGQAHVKRKLSIPDRSRSVSPHRIETPYPVYDKYQKYEKHRKGKYEEIGNLKIFAFFKLAIFRLDDQIWHQMGWCGIRIKLSFPYSFG